MFLRNLFTQEQIGFAIGYIAVFLVDNFIKFGTVRYGYKTISWVANKTKISPPTGQVLFERVVDNV